MKYKLYTEDLEIIGVVSSAIGIFGMILFESFLPLLLLAVWAVCIIKIINYK